MISPYSTVGAEFRVSGREERTTRIEIFELYRS